MQSTKLSGGKTGVPSQKFLDISEIRDDTLILKDGTLRGILLDDRDPIRLEAMMFNLDPAVEPQSQIGSAVMGSLASASARVLSAKTSVEVAQERQFLIPYNIGTPLGDTFQQYLLKWSGGEVTFSCSVRFD